MRTNDFDPIHPDESEVLIFDFANDLPSGDTLDSSTLSVEVVSGTDVTPSARLIGSPSIQGTSVLHRVSGCLANVVYRVECKAVTTQSNTLVLFAHLRCVEPY